MITLLDKNQIGQEEVYIYGKIYKVNEPIFDKQIGNKKYDLVIPTVCIMDTDNVMRAALICFPKYDKIKNEPLLDYASGEKVLYSIVLEE